MNTTGNNFKKKEPFRQGIFSLIGNYKGYLIGARCDRCKINYFPSRGFCSSCFQNDQMKQVNLSKIGTLYTYTTVYRGKPNFKVPYSVGYVDLKEGVRILAPLFDVAPGELKIGMEMELVFRDMDWVSGQEETLVYGFKPVKKESAE